MEGDAVVLADGPWFDELEALPAFHAGASETWLLSAQPEHPLQHYPSTPIVFFNSAQTRDEVYSATYVPAMADTFIFQLGGASLAMVVGCMQDRPKGLIARQALIRFGIC